MSLVLAPGISTSFATAGMTSAHGRCHTFDARADGYARGEACGGVVLRGGAEAEAVGLLGSAVRQDGRSASLTAPNGQAQQGLLEAAMQDAKTSVDALELSEAHGTGTALGDPIEARSLKGAVLALREAPIAVGGVKANIGHAEAAAGMTGLLKLAVCLQRGEVAPNAQLRVLNRHVGGAVPAKACSLQVQMSKATIHGRSGGVSSFGYSGTIAHAVLRHAAATPMLDAAPSALVYRRRAFLWHGLPHPFAQCRLPTSSDGAVAIRSPAAGALHALVAHHVIQGRVIFPGVGYLEMARAAATTPLHGVFFLQPLAVETPGLLIECALDDGGFEVRSSEDQSFEAATVHCIGALASDEKCRQADNALARSSSCTHAAGVGALYDGFDAVGLEYGPAYRTLVQVIVGKQEAVGRLRSRSRLEGMLVHPADLDDALCLSTLAAAASGDGETRLPFLVDDVQLQGVAGELWAVRCSALIAALLLHATLTCRGAIAGRRAAECRGGVSTAGWPCCTAPGAAGWLQGARAACCGASAARCVRDGVVCTGGAGRWSGHVIADDWGCLVGGV